MTVAGSCATNVPRLGSAIWPMLECLRSRPLARRGATFATGAENRLGSFVPPGRDDVCLCDRSA